MLSKNNRKLQAQKLEPRSQHFTIKKFTIGVASVLIGSTFVLTVGNDRVSANENTGEPLTEKVTPSDTEVDENVIPFSSEDTEVDDQTQTDAESTPETVETSESTPEATTIAEETTPTAQEEDVTEQEAPTTELTDETQALPNDSAMDAPATETETPTLEETPTSEASTTTQAKDLEIEPVEAPAPTSTEDKALTEQANTQERGMTTFAASDSSQWPSNSTDAIGNESGISVPQTEYNYTFSTISMNPDKLTGTAILDGNVIPFTVAHYMQGSNSQERYKIRIQLDQRMADMVESITLNPADNYNANAGRTFTRVINSDGTLSNIWEIPFIYAQGGIFGGAAISASYIAPLGKITLKDSVKNTLTALGDVANNPLIYNIYVYDAQTKRSLEGDDSQGFFITEGNPLNDITISDDDRVIGGDYFLGSTTQVGYDNLGDPNGNGGIIVDYAAQKKGPVWSYTNGQGWTLNFQIDKELLQHLEKNADGTYNVELDMRDFNGLDGFFYKDSAGNKTQAYNPKNKVDPAKFTVTLNENGIGQIVPKNGLTNIVATNPALPEPIGTRLVFRLNKPIEEVFAAMKANGRADKDLLFAVYFANSTNEAIRNSIGTSLISFSDSDGDNIPDAKEDADKTNPYVSIPDVSNVYETETVVKGIVAINRNETADQIITVLDKNGNVLGTTTITPTFSEGDGDVKNFAYSVDIPSQAAGTELTVSVKSKFDNGGDKNAVDNSQPQTTTVTVGVAPTAQAIETATKPDLSDTATKEEIIALLPTAKDGVANSSEFPTGATYTWEEVPAVADLKTPGTTTGKVKVSFPDEFDPSYIHELLVEVPITVKDTESAKYEPVATPIVKPFGEATTEENIIGAITFAPEYPAGPNQPSITVDDISSLPDGNTPGVYNVPVTVTYPDGSTDKTTVEVTVLDKIIDRTNDPSAPIPEGYVRVTFNAGTDGKFADGASTIFDVKKGTDLAELTLPTVVPNEGFVQKDGAEAWSPALPATFETTAEYTAQYKAAATDAETYTPEGQDIQTDIGSTPDPAEGIKNKGDLPEGTKYEWKEPVDTTTPGEKDGTIVVTYPDGSSEEVPVKV
ncbi:Rib/alpha-like domain-containing protein, partial [Ligilactobacillus faecis]